MSDNLEELKEKTRKTAEKYFEGLPPEDRAYHLWRSFDKELAKEISMHYTGRLYSREKIPHQTRQLVTVAALTVLERREELRTHIWAALNVGCTSEEIAEVIFQMGTYGGVPVVNTALKTLRDVLEARGEGKK
ncbi:MAG: carboxymuconolactone decarboxylase family protein [Deltaproteobacteria bacterium]|nr:carboxymuconolactone decarboxylase family protein [Deltaproteobacteria bacterium]MBW2051080.1 carboxymuconolactone decarboxylase family protein [Deltaproteobacteria bacterium]MBW2141052.1 carboxymuconolactone decarboxylase family protein [Deltaproteobacteria bacterium]MBW2322590.1 carboxymuconolactone decarboxylase family protein [Deltaproteobacteria bacterium]